MFNTIANPTLHTVSIKSEATDLARFQERLEQLRRTDLYDPQYEQWNMSLNYGQLASNLRCSQNQLLEVVVEGLISPHTVEKRYAAARNFFYAHDAIPGYWIHSFTRSQQIHSSDKNLANELLGVWALSFLNRDSALAELRDLEPSYRRKPGDLWRRGFKDSWWSYPVIGAVVEGTFDPVSGAAQFERLRGSDFWQKSDNAWRRQCDIGYDSKNEIYYTIDQLWGIVAEAIFSPATACQSLAELRSKGHFDHASGNWNHAVSAKGTIDQRLHSWDQLLGIIAEIKISQIEPLAPTEVEALPRIAVSLKEKRDV